MSVRSAKTYEKTRLSRSTRPKTSSCPRKATVPYVPGSMRRQSRSAAVGSSTMASCLSLPLTKGTTHAPTISTSPGCTHSTVIVVFPTHQPQLPEQLRPDDDRGAGNQPVHRFPGRKIFERELCVLLVEDIRRRDFAQGNHRQTGVEPALQARQARRILQLPFEKLHRHTIPASFRTGAG